MERRKFVTGIAGGGVAVIGGLHGLFSGGGGEGGNETSNESQMNETTDTNGETDTTEEQETNVESEFTLFDPEELDVDGSPEIYIEDGVVTVQGTIAYASSGCGTAELAHVGYEQTQKRVDLLVIAADDPDASGDVCTADMVETGYQAVVVPDGEFNQVVVSSHGAFGTNSASFSSR